MSNKAARQTNATIQPIKIVFMGSPDFAIPSLEAIKKLRGFRLITCLIAPDRPQGRHQKVTPPPVKAWAQKNKIPVFQPESIKNPESIQKIRELAPDFIVVAAYGQILPKEILDIPEFKALNIHASILPKYRGASPIQSAILNGDNKTGITIIQMDEKMDHGPIVAQKELELKGGETGGILHDKLADLGAELLKKALPEWIAGKTKPVPQEDLDATYTKILTREDGKIYWDKSAEELERQLRAFDPWPGSFTEWERRPGEYLRIKILRAGVKKANTEDEERPFGQVFLTEEKELAVNTAKDYLIIEKLQVEGKTPMDVQEFLNGYPTILGNSLI